MSVQEPDADDAGDGETEEMTLVEGVRDALRVEMARDDSVMVMGEDVGENGGVFRATEGLIDDYGPERVVDTPLSESGIVGTAIGLAVRGERPVAEIQFMGFVYPAFDQLVSHAARIRTRSRGRFSCPLVVRMPYGGGIAAPESHSESKEAFFVHEPGLKVAVPSMPSDAKGLLAAAIRDPDPVIYLEPKQIYRAFREPVPTGEHVAALGEAQVRREGSDVAVYAWGAMVREALDAAEAVAEDGIEAEVVDLRSLSPLDRATIRDSFEKTGRGVVVHEAPRTAGVGAEVVASLQDASLLYQEAPIVRVAGDDAPYPLAQLEDHYLPDADTVEGGIREAVEF